MKKIISVFVCLFAFTLSSLSVSFGAKPRGESKDVLVQERPVHWVNVFIHGTHGFGLSAFSLFKVMHDQCEGTLYHFVQKQWRNNAAAVTPNRLMGELGLTRVDEAACSDTSIAPDIIKGYATCANMVKASHEVNHYYTFGWSGLLSSEARSKAALELHHELTKELTRLRTDIKCSQKTDVEPIIRVRALCHSHGGSVALSLGAIKDSCIIIDQLILLAAPIQPETEKFCCAPCFKEIYNFYSENDGIQATDFISTKCRKSGQKIEVGAFPVTRQKHIVQVQVMAERTVEACGVSPSVGERFKALHGRAKASLGGGKLSCLHHKDPTHADFWCIEKNRDTLIAPIPIVVLTPLLLHLLSKNKHLADVGVNIHKDERDLLFSLCQPNDIGIRYGWLAVPHGVVAGIKERLKKAKPLVSKFSFSFGGGSSLRSQL